MGKTVARRLLPHQLMIYSQQIIICLLLILAGWIQTPAAHAESKKGKRVIVLGIDGMDYTTTRRLIDQGKLPNLKLIARKGSFLSLQTSMPPLSPVAWSSFITGMDPGGHGIFDFLRRDPAKVRSGFLPEDAVSQIQIDNDSAWPIPFTNYILPPSQQQVVLRRGVALWDILQNHGIDTRIYKIPATFPVPKTNAEVLAGMGTPDVEGTYGSFTYLTSRNADWDRFITGGRILRASMADGIIQVIGEDERLTRPYLHGPPNPFHHNNDSPAVVPFDVYVDPQERTAALIVQNRPYVLREGEWSQWIDIEFDLFPLADPVQGITRFYLQEVTPEFRLFISAIHLAPGTTGLASGGFDLRLQQSLGLFHTKGMPQLTKAAMQDILSPDEYLNHSRSLLEEKVNAMQFLLNEPRDGFLFVYFSAIDLDSHVLWKHQDPEHPAHTTAEASHYGNSIVDLYAKMDQVVGIALTHLHPDDQLYVLSDHGFAPQRRAFNVTTWLAQNDYLAYESDAALKTSSLFSGIDWSESRAYGLGFNGLYINLHGRESAGIVAPQDYHALVNELRAKLLSLEDRGQRVFAHIYRPEDIYHGPYLDRAPDLILGYAPPYGPSDESVLGTPSEQVITDHTDGFSGHHAVDLHFVPGVLFSTRTFNAKKPRIEDVTATLIHEFNITPPPQTTGKPLY